MIDLNNMTIKNISHAVSELILDYYEQVLTPCCQNISFGMAKCPKHHDILRIIQILNIMKFYDATKLIVHIKKIPHMELWKGNLLLAKLGKSQIKHLFAEDKDGIEKFLSMRKLGYRGEFNIIVDKLLRPNIKYFDDENFLNKNNIFKAD